MNAREHVIRRSLFGPIFLSVMSLCCLILSFQDTTSIESKNLIDATDATDIIDAIDVYFYSALGISIWIPITVVMFTLSAIHLYFYFRFKVVVHEKGFAVTPLFGATYDVPYASVEKVVHVGWSKKGAFIDILYQNQKLRIPYTRNRHGNFKQKGFEVLLRKFRSCNVPISEHLDLRENLGKKYFS